MKLSIESVDGLRCLSIESAELSCRILPDPGGKMISLTDKRSGREWIKPETPVAYRLIGYGKEYPDFDRTGFDDCFPAIAFSQYPYEPWKGTVIPDHGEIWTMPWAYTETESGLEMQVHGVRFPYVFKKRISVEDDRVLLSYRVENPTSCDMPCFWSAHPLFRVREGMRVILPGHQKLLVEYCKYDRFGKRLDELTWPIAMNSSGDSYDLSTIGPKSSDLAAKVYACNVEDGYTSLYDPQSKDYLYFTFDKGRVPHVGLWSNIGGWPFNGNPDYNCALEPCSGYPDVLGMGEHQTVPAHGDLSWSVCIRIGQTDSEQSLIGALKSL